MNQFVQANLPFIIFIAVAVVAWLLLRTKATRFAAGSSLDAMIGGGRPVVLEFFGNT